MKKRIDTVDLVLHRIGFHYSLLIEKLDKESLMQALTEIYKHAETIPEGSVGYQKLHDEGGLDVISKYFSDLLMEKMVLGEDNEQQTNKVSKQKKTTKRTK